MESHLFSFYLADTENLARDRRVYIKWASRELGYGVFANANIPKYAIIGVYGGVIKRQSLDTDYSWNLRFLDTDSGDIQEFAIDGRQRGSVLRFVNVRALSISDSNRPADSIAMSQTCSR